MNNKQYELIGESIWNIYEDIAYILAEAKSPKEHAAAIRQATQDRAQDWSAEGLKTADIAAKKALKRRKKREKVQKTARETRKLSAEGDAGRARDAESQRQFAALPRTNIKSWNKKPFLKKPK